MLIMMQAKYAGTHSAYFANSSCAFAASTCTSCCAFLTFSIILPMFPNAAKGFLPPPYGHTDCVADTVQQPHSVQTDVVCNNSPHQHLPCYQTGLVSAASDVEPACKQPQASDTQLTTIASSEQQPIQTSVKHLQA